MTVLTAELWLESFVKHLEKMDEADGKVGQIASFVNGFEDWLKFEMAAMLQREPWCYRPWVLGKEGDLREDVGVEWPTKLKGSKSRKKIDVWASPTRHATRWHFAELKVVFKGFNELKQVRSWRDDMYALRRIDEKVELQKTQSTMSVMFAVGFEPGQLDGRIEELLAEARPRMQVSWRRDVALKSGGSLTIVALIDGR